MDADATSGSTSSSTDVVTRNLNFLRAQLGSLHSQDLRRNLEVHVNVSTIRVP